MTGVMLVSPISFSSDDNDINTANLNQNCNGGTMTVITDDYSANGNSSLSSPSTLNVVIDVASGQGSSDYFPVSSISFAVSDVGSYIQAVQIDSIATSDDVPTNTGVIDDSYILSFVPSDNQNGTLGTIMLPIAYAPVAVTTQSVDAGNSGLITSAITGTVLLPTDPTKTINIGASGTITNTGTIVSTTGGSSGGITVDSGTPITNIGTIQSTGDNSGAINLGGGTLTNNGTIVSAGGGETLVIGANGGVITNKGTPVIGSGTVTPIPTSNYPMTITNTGTISSVSGTPITIDSDSEVTLYNFGVISSQTDVPAIVFNDESHGKIINGGIIDSGVRVDKSHEGDYVIHIGGSESITLVGNQDMDFDLETGEAFGVLASDTNFVQGNSGTENDDIIEGDDTDQTMLGLEGDDWILAKGGNDIVYAGSGDDYVSGGLGNDKIAGGEGRDFILGGEGNDTLIGGEGDDILVSGEGKDFLVGGLGKDIFVFTQNDSVFLDEDIIMDFEQGEDKISLIGNVDSFGDLTVLSNNGNTAVFSTSDADDFLLYLKGEYDLTEQDFYFENGNSQTGSVSILEDPPIISGGNTGVIVDNPEIDYIV